MKYSIFGIFLLLTSLQVTAQFRNLPNAVYFKDQAFFSDSSFAPIFPLSDRECGTFKHLQDTVKRYSMVGVFVYQRELIELHKKEGSLWITPLLDIQGGIERGDTSMRQFLNVRGVCLEALLGKRLFVSTSIYENQGFLPQYVRNYVNKRGEFYPNGADSTYTQVNAFIPNGARTKPFKIGGYDYAYATGLIRWDATKWLTLSGGNQPLFIGSGYRSLIFTDNTAPSMFGRIAIRLGKHIDYQVVRLAGTNLLRIPYVSNGEAFYERKAMSINSIYFKIGKKIRLGLVETAVWSRGDSLQKKPVAGGFYIPLPGGGLLQQSLNKACMALLAVDMHYKVNAHLGIYGQFGMNVQQVNSEMVQIGGRIWPTKSPNWMIQVEYNHTGIHAYENPNPRLNYASYNLPLGHIMGNGVDEFIFRVQGEWKKIFFNLKQNYYLNQLISRNQLLPVYQTLNYKRQQVAITQMELGYRMNKTYAFEIFGNLQYRITNSTKEQGAWVLLGIRTQLNNRYFDF